MRVLPDAPPEPGKPPAAGRARRGKRRAARLDSERETAIATGCDEFDVKPIEFESLDATIRRAVANPKKFIRTRMTRRRPAGAP